MRKKWAPPPILLFPLRDAHLSSECMNLLPFHPTPDRWVSNITSAFFTFLSQFTSCSPSFNPWVPVSTTTFLFSLRVASPHSVSSLHLLFLPPFILVQRCHWVNLLNHNLSLFLSLFAALTSNTYQRLTLTLAASFHPHPHPLNPWTSFTLSTLVTMTSTATSSPVSPGRINPFHSGQHHFYHNHGHHLYSPILNKKRFNSPIRVDELDFISHPSLSLIDESDCVLLDLLKSNSQHFVSSSPAKTSIYMTNVNIAHPTNPSPPTSDICPPDQSLLNVSSNTSSIPLSPIDEEESEIESLQQEQQQQQQQRQQANQLQLQQRPQPPRSPPQQVPSSSAAKYDATLPKKSPTRSLLSSFTPSVEIVIEDTSQMIWKDTQQWQQQQQH